MEARVRKIRPHLVRADFEWGLAAPGNGALHLSADTVPGPRGVRLAKDQRKDPGDWGREGWAGFPQTRQAHCRQHSGSRTGDHPQCGARSAPGSAGPFLSAAVEIPPVTRTLLGYAFLLLREELQHRRDL